MHSLTIKGLQKIESKIDEALGGRSPIDPGLEKELRDLIIRHTSEVFCYNRCHAEKYENKYWEAIVSRGRVHSQYMNSYQHGFFQHDPFIDRHHVPDSSPDRNPRNR